MQRRHVTGLGLLALGQWGCASAGHVPAGNAPKKAAPRVVHIIGDSTAAEFPASDPRVGWGAMLSAELVGIRVNDAARSGRSSKSYFEEGHFSAVEAQLAPGDLLLVQFGHNDEKDDPLRHTDAATTFRDNLRRYISAGRARGAVPVLLTPICRRRFTGTRVTQSHGDFPDATRAVARETSTPLVDMTLKTAQLLESLGLEACARLFAPDDNTHLSPEGARAVARLVVTGLAEVGFDLPARPAHSAG